MKMNKFLNPPNQNDSAQKRRCWQFFRFLGKKISRATILFLLFFGLSSCTSYETPELPDLNAESFSYESMTKRQKELQQKAISIRKKNSELDD
jgi:hypothetical protein